MSSWLFSTIIRSNGYFIEKIVVRAMRALLTVMIKLIGIAWFLLPTSTVNGIRIVHFLLVPTTTVLTQTFFIFSLVNLRPLPLWLTSTKFAYLANNIADDSDWLHVCNWGVLLLRWQRWSSALGSTRISQLRKLAIAHWDNVTWVFQ